ncbi:hypothetical protein EG68_11840 [Paragonimus skrjabini miyazakii]|uniref:Uncharacterized protein n=1 Tax=Paragonimus skrjabini miyazakii TaxID=59628 RepID=A0A8S9YHI3_9TREM|nr:hypothetical protein EG68_11840 [Paragonimus skrjabini miyazakii]
MCASGSHVITIIIKPFPIYHSLICPCIPFSVHSKARNAPAFHVRNPPSPNTLLVEILQPEDGPSGCEWIVQLNITLLNGWPKTHLLSAPGVHLLAYSTSEMSQQLSACFTTSGIDCTSEKSHIKRKPHAGE